MSRVFNMTVKEFNFTATVQNWTDPIASNFTTLNRATGVINTWSAWDVIGRPLTTAWAALFDSRFPPIDPARRPGWRNFNESLTNQTTYNAALVTKNRGVEWYERELQYSTPESCSESILIYDIGTGGLPSFRERELNDSPDASYLAVLPEKVKPLAQALDVDTMGLTRQEMINASVEAIRALYADIDFPEHFTAAQLPPERVREMAARSVPGLYAGIAAASYDPATATDRTIIACPSARRMTVRQAEAIFERCL